MRLINFLPNLIHWLKSPIFLPVFLLNTRSLICLFFCLFFYQNTLSAVPLVYLPFVEFNCQEIEIDEGKDCLRICCIGDVYLHMKDACITFRTEKATLECVKKGSNYDLLWLKTVGVSQLDYKDSQNIPYRLTWEGEFYLNHQNKSAILTPKNCFGLKATHLEVQGQHAKAFYTDNNGHLELRELLIEEKVHLKHGVSPSLDQPLLVLQEIKGDRLEVKVPLSRAICSSKTGWVRMVESTHNMEMMAKAVELIQKPSSEWAFRGLGDVRLKPIEGGNK